MTTPAAPADPWFQSLFADRIGGVHYGKSDKIYKFEKIKRAKRAAPTNSKTAATPTTASPRSRKRRRAS
jgi:hypothetical protein